ncbi:MAG TPA: hypothetical protein VLK84_26470 [Longimicrobium sp.]|nr:hypothetical protein [Longimicrobium sp.]
MTGAASDAPLGRLTFTQGVSAIRVLNWDALFEGGVCARCGMACGPRTDEPVRFRHVEASGARSDGWLAGPSPFGARMCLYSERFLALLTDEERGLLHWRPAENTAFGDRAVFELAGSAHPVPLARPHGGAPYVERCGECGWEPPPHYSANTTHPDWMMRFARAGGFLPRLYVAAADLPDPPPAAFTVGDVRDSLLLALHPARWAEFVSLPDKRRLRGVQGWDLGVLPAERVEG